MALRLARISRRGWGWLLVSMAMAVMAVRSGLMAWELMVAHRPAPQAEFVFLVVSLLLLIGMVDLGGRLGEGEQTRMALEEAQTEAGSDPTRIAQPGIPAQELIERGGADRQDAELGRLLIQMMDSTDVWISALDKDGRAVLWNRAAEEISGYAREEVLGRADFLEWLAPDAGSSASSLDLGTLIRKGERIPGETAALERKDGTARTLVWHISSVARPQGEALGSFAVAHDLTRTQAEAGDLHRDRSFQDLVLDNSALGLVLVRHRTFRWLNPKAAEILGVSARASVGAPVRGCFTDDANYQTFLERAVPLLAKGGYADLRLRLKRASGTLCWCRLVGKALDPAHVDEGAVWMIEDITAQTVMESTLAESEERFRGAFEGTLDALILTTPKGIFDCNQQALKVFGFHDKSEILQKSLNELSPVNQAGGKSSVELLGHHLQSALVGERERFHWIFRRQGTGDFHAEVYMNALSMGRRNVILACVRPVEPSLAGLRDLDREIGIRAFLDQNPTPILLLDSQTHRFVYCNRAVLTILRCHLDEVYGLGPEDLSPPYQPDGRSSLDFSREMMALAFHGGSHRFRHIHRSPHRGDFPVDVTLTALQPGHSPLLVVNWAEVSE